MKWKKRVQTLWEGMMDNLVQRFPMDIHKNAPSQNIFKF